jgi:hypothetical protein
MFHFPDLDPDESEEKGLYPIISYKEKEKVHGMEPFSSYLYHRTKPHGKVFTDEIEFNEALQNGWKEAPWLVFEEKKVEVAIPQKVEHLAAQPKPKRKYFRKAKK